MLASACANNAAPNYTTPNQTTTNQAAPRVTNFDGLHTRTYDGMRGYNGATPGTYNGVRPYTAFPDGNVGLNPATGTAGIRGVGPVYTGVNQSIYQKRAWNRAGAGVMQAGVPRFGYVRTDRQQVRTAAANNVYVDRNALAQAVGNVTSSCPGVQRSTVLVTDEEVFVGLNTAGADALTAKNQAQMNAMSVSPRYYKVYVTDNPNDIQEIARVASRTSNLHNARTDETASIDTLIKRMGGTTDREQVRAKNAGKMGTTSR